MDETFEDITSDMTTTVLDAVKVVLIFFHVIPVRVSFICGFERASFNSLYNFCDLCLVKQVVVSIW